MFLFPLCILALALLLVPLPAIGLIQANVFPILSTQVQSSTLAVSGRSVSDAWDRVVSVTYHGIEVARVITPDRLQFVPNGHGGDLVCVPQDGLCNRFSLNVTLPFVPNPYLLGVQTGFLGAPWSFAVSGDGSGDARLSSLIPMQRTLSGERVNFTVPQAGEVYLLVSGHNQCETAIPSVLKVDNQSASILNWSYGEPFADRTRFTSGVVIPYVSFYLDSGTHSVWPSCGAAGESYFLISAFEVDPTGGWSFW